MHRDNQTSNLQRASSADGIEGALQQLELQTPAPPPLADLRTVIESSHTREGIRMNFINFISGRPWPLRLAMALGCLAVLFALSQLLPFAGGLSNAPKVSAYSGGYVLIFDFGRTPPSEETHRQGMAILEEWKQKNGISSEDGLAIRGGQDIVDGNVTFTLGLIGATLEQTNSLLDALKAIPGIPVPRVVEAQWYEVEAVEAEKRGEALLYEFDHAFIFSRGTTGEQMEQAIRDYLIETRGSCDYEINVSVEWNDKGHSINITVRDPDEAKGQDKAAETDHLQHSGGH